MGIMTKVLMFPFSILKWLYRKFLVFRVFIFSLIFLIPIWFIGMSASEYTKNETYGWYAIGCICFIGLMSLTYQIMKTLGFEKEDKRKYKYSSAYNDLYKLNPYEFEKFIEDLFSKMDYSARVTTKSNGNEGGDYGADLIAKKNGNTIIVQVKRWRSGNLVGADAIRSTLGAMPKFKADKSIILTTSDFTEQAYEQAKEAPIELWNGRYLEELIAKYKPIYVPNRE